MLYRHPTPWRVVPEEGLPLIVSAIEPGYIAQCFDDDGNARKNAEFIVKAVNQHLDYEHFVKELERVVKAQPKKVTADWLLRKIDTLNALLVYEP